MEEERAAISGNFEESTPTCRSETIAKRWGFNEKLRRKRHEVDNVEEIPKSGCLDWT
jgi:hypothetical protein